MKKLNVCILGGSGFVGHNLIAKLSPKVNHITVLTRRLNANKDLLVFPNISVIEVNIIQCTSLNKYLNGADIVINLVGIINENLTKGATFRKVHVDLTQKILNACAHNNVQRLLHMSTLNANASSGKSIYLRSKGEAENMAHTFTQTGLTVTSFRPSVIFGENDAFFNRLARMLRVLPYLPLACPNSRFSPVYVGDVSDAIINAITDKSTQGKRIELCGPKSYRLVDLAYYTRRLQNSSTWIFALPDSFSRIMASILQFMPGKPFTPDNYNSMQIDSVCSADNDCCRTSVESIVPSYIGNDNEQTRLQNYRASVRR